MSPPLMGLGRTIWAGSRQHLEEVERWLLFITDLVYLALGLLILSPTFKHRPQLPALLLVPGILPVASELPAGLVVDSSSGQWARFIPGVPSLTLIKLLQGGIWPALFVSCAPMPGERQQGASKGCDSPISAWDRIPAPLSAVGHQHPLMGREKGIQQRVPYRTSRLMGLQISSPCLVPGLPGGRQAE